MKACTFFGHRDTPPSVEQRLVTTIQDLIVKEKVNIFYIGHQGAFDMMVYRILQKLKKRYTHIHYTVVLAYMPHREIVYENTVLPEGIETTIPRLAILWRNRWMVERADFVVTYVCRSAGGAATFEKMAKNMGKRIVALYP